MQIEIKECELEVLILSLIYLRKLLRNENEYKDIALKMINESYEIESKLVKYLDSIKR